MRTEIRRRQTLLSLLLFSVTNSGGALAQEARLTEREVSFRNGAVELHGTLMLPSTPGRHPAVVFLHGSGPATREGARTYAEEFARLGLASLFFDKRGSGSSGGSWLTSSLEDLAQDARAAVQYAKTQEEIDPGRIGFWGVSQAGWVATLAASESADVAFMILVSGGGASPRESEMFSYGQAFDRARLSEQDKADASEVLELYFAYLETGEGRASLLEIIEDSRESPWYPLARLDRILPSEESRAAWSWVATWDPARHTEKITCPVLLLFGDRDTDHPTEVAVRRWREGLAKAGNEKVTLMVFAGAGHGIRMRAEHDGPGRPPFADGYHEVMAGWFWRHVLESGQ